MTGEELAQRLAEIENFDSGLGMAPANDDPQVAHQMLDCLYVDVLRAIADGAGDAQFLAAKALEGESIEFPRWCA